MSKILSIDVGTTVFKAGIFSSELELICDTSRDYDVNLYDQGKADIEPEKWWQALKSSCEELRPHLSDVDVLSLSVTTPGLVPIAQDGSALGPAILFFDQRSQEQAGLIRERIGEEFFIKEACNLPVSGGSSLCSIMWILENQPGIWEQTHKFGHTNTYMVRRFTGQWVIDPSTTSLTGLYHTRLHQLTWLQEVLEKAEISPEKLPTLMHSHHKAGIILPEIADELSLPKDAIVLCGGNDAVLAGFSAGLKEPGEAIDIVGTCEIIAACLDHPVGSRNYNIRCHVLPERWVTFFVLNTGGKALEWFHSVFCRDMSADEFYETFVPQTIERFLEKSEYDENSIPKYSPFLQGSRYSLDNLTASFSNLNLETNREKMLLGLLRGNLQYIGGHLKEISEFMKLKNRITTTGGGARIRGMNSLKKLWMGDFEYEYQNESSLLGAAMLGKMYLDGL